METQFALLKAKLCWEMYSLSLSEYLPVHFQKSAPSWLST